MVDNVTEKLTTRERERTSDTVERRMVPTSFRMLSPEERAASASGPGTFEGYAAVFNSRTWIGDPTWGFWEQIAPGAFRDSIKSDDVVSLFNHNIDLLLGRTTSGTLRLSEDEKGLLSTTDLPDTQLGRDLAVQVARHDVDGMSFSFMVAPGDGERWEILPDGSELRTVLKTSLFDTSPVVMPAYTDTTASMRAAQLGRRNRPEPEPAPEERADEDVPDLEELRETFEARARFVGYGNDLFGVKIDAE